jgi:HNH endonuclease
MPTIFFNTAWMDFYRGQSEDDLPRDGGSWEEKHEVCNFLPLNGSCFCFVQPAGETIAIERIGADASDDHIDGVTIVWSARSPSGRTVVVGFYRNARLHRHRQKIPRSAVHEANKLQHYFAECREEDAILISHKRRDVRIPRGSDAMGQSLVWYGDTARGLEEARKIESLLAQLEQTQSEADRDAATAEGDGATIGSFDPIQEELEQDVRAVLDSDLTASEKISLLKARIGQGKFRQQVMQVWRNGCAVTGCQIGPILRASHIKAWRDCANKQERLDSDNGLLLSANLDALFDRGLISFADNGNMLVSAVIAEVDRKRLGLGLPLTIRPSSRQSRYLKHHRETHGFG